MKVKNEIKGVLEATSISIRSLARMTGKTYKAMYTTCTAEYIDNTRIGTLVDIADALGVRLEDLYTIEKE